MNYTPLREIFDLTPLELTDWGIIILLVPATFVYSEILKWNVRRKINPDFQALP
jgi:hypothetical protein